MDEECEVAHIDSNKTNSVGLWALKDPNVAKHLFLINDKYVIVSVLAILYLCINHIT